jgi:plastocyanin
MTDARPMIALVLALAACKAADSTSGTPDGSAPTDASSDAAAAGDAVSPSDAGAPGDAAADGPPLVNYNDCTNVDFDQNDLTAPDASRIVVFSFDPQPVQYKPRCLKVKANETVRWEGSFASHPLVSSGGDVPNPIDGVMVDASAGFVTFPNPGWYGFECQVHESPAEYGAILVVP